MNYELYKKIYRRLNSKEDIDPIAKNFDMEEDALWSILCQKIVRKTKKKYYKIKGKRGKLEREWKNGKSIMTISKKYNFPPVLTASFIFEYKFSNKEFKKYLKNPDSIKDERIKKEVQEAVEHDIVYSPKYIDLQRESGIKSEKEIEEWLVERDIKFITEGDARKENFRKTPDFLLMNPLSLDGLEVRWIESKAGFGDLIKFKEDFGGQLRPYVRIFGSGLIVYWVGHLERLTTFSDRILVVSKNFFEEKSRKNYK